MSLAGKTALVTGGSGTVGAGVLDQLVHAGATVIVPLRGSKDSVLQSLGDVDVSKLDFVSANVGDEKSVVKLAEYINQKYGSIDHVVTSVGGWWQKGPLLQLQTAEFLKEYGTYVVPHFLLAKYLLPLVKPTQESSFTFVTGAAGEHVFILDSGLITAHLSALYGVIKCIQAEYANKHVRVNELRIAAVVRRHQEKINLALPDEIRNVTGEYTNRAVGKAAVKLALNSTGSNFLKLGPAELQQLDSE